MEKSYWDQRWQDNQTGWDIGCVSTPLKNYIDQLAEKKIKILIPGAGNAYEAEYLWKNGFTSTFVCDISIGAIESFKTRFPEFPKEQIIFGDFFELTEKFDLILEQTFFCAIEPSRRKDYVQKVAELLNDTGKLVGVLFNRSFEGGPPFGGSKDEYASLFADKFEFKTFETCTNSIEPRKYTELFVNFLKK